LVTQITRLTHTHQQAILGANLQSFAVDMALNSSSSFSPDEMVDILITLMKMIEDEPKKMKEKKKDDSKGDHRYFSEVIILL
jgi:ADP-ribosylglycohydrolase